jgi:F-type H+-transporting ATPase subunit gamma
MATLKDVQLKIKAVTKTKQITKAMNMVATSRLRGAQRAMEAFRPYANKFAEVLGSLAESAGEDASPLLIRRGKVNNILIVLCTSDRGLCGGFNLNLTAKAKAFMAQKAAEDASFSFTSFGKRGRDWCRKEKLSIAEEHLGIMGTNIGFGTASVTVRKLVGGFLAGEYDEVHLVFSEFQSMSRQVPVVQQLLPIPPIEKAETPDEAIGKYRAEHICEPSAEGLLADLLPKSVMVQLYRGLLETSTSEHAARMMAMDNATKACNDMIESLTLAYNKARQAAITLDLMDIVSGAEALKG